MAEHLETEESSSILDWLESVPTNADSQLNLDNVGGPASPPWPSQLFPTCSPHVSPTNHPLLRTSPRMTHNFPDHELSLSQAMETYTDDGETPASSCTSRSLRALSTENPSHQPPLRPEKLRFLPLDEWDPRNIYDEEVPTCLHYSIEWKVFVNKRVIL